MLWLRVFASQLTLWVIRAVLVSILVLSKPDDFELARSSMRAQLLLDPWLLVRQIAILLCHCG